MREVSCGATEMILEALEDAGLRVDGIADGLPITLAELRNPRARVGWDAFAEFLERVEERARGVVTVEELGERVLKVPSFEWLRRAGRLLVSPRQLYELANRLIAPVLFPNVIVQREWLPSGRLVMTGELLPGDRSSTIFFRMCHANVAAVPRVLDLPASVIEEQTISGRRGRLVLVPPASHTLATRLRRSVRALGTLPEAWRAISQQQRELEDSLSALRTSRRELQLLLERLPDGVLIHERGIIRWANASLVAILGASRVDAVVGHHVLDFMPPGERPKIERALKSAPPTEIDPTPREYPLLRADGTIRRVEAGVAQVVDFHGVKARLVVLRDVTEHHRLREQAAISDRLASIGALAAGVAHEINNPLAYARLNLEMALRLAPETSSPELRTSLALAREGTDHALNIVRDMKLLSRTHGDQTELVDLPALIDSTLALAEGAIQSKARLVRRYEPTPFAVAPRGRLAQVFLNLLSNASDAIPVGSPATHVISATTCTDAKGRAVVEIFDSGVGVPAEIAPRVFDAFFTTKPFGVGTGLGLAICHRIVTELGGELTFESEPGATTFRVALPPAP